MSYTVTTNYDNRIPSWPGNGTPFTLIACHDTEGGQGRSGALGTIQFLIDRSDRGASYHEMWWYHESTDEFGVIRIVPPYRAAGSIAPQTTVYQPTTWVKNAMGANWWDPNQGVYAVSIAGRVADVDRYSRNPKFLAHAHRRMMELWKELNLTKRAEHFQFNPSTRSDWGRLLMPALGGLVTRDDFRPPAEAIPVATLSQMKPAIMRIRAGTSIRYRPDLSAESKPFVIDSDAWVTAIAKVNDGWDFGAGPVWYAYVISTGGLRYFHSQDIETQRTLIDPSSAITDCSAEVSKAVAPLNAKITEQVVTIETQADKIAALMTDVADAETAQRNAEAAAAEATETAANAVALKTALQNFLG